MKDKPRTSEEVRKAYLDFFQRIDHKIVASSSLIPKTDKTLLFTNAGMNQFKDVLLGLETRDYKRAASCQLCMRAGGKHNDLDAVGKDGRHNTFFEMLGNWSFGDYWKKEAIAWAWDFVTNVLKMSEELLYATVYKTDDEAYDIWKNDVGIPEERIFRLGDIDLGDEENFWSMGPTGPCGPCSELYYDMGPDIGCGSADCQPGCDCDRYMEFWNIVFMESDRKDDGSFVPLDFQSIDTGLGFERTVAIQQGVTNIFETDLFQPIVEAIKKLEKIELSEESDRASLTVIADHLRALTFTLAEGASFANEGMGYVLRRILRRAVRHGHMLGADEPFLYKLVDAVTGKMGDVYPHIVKNKEEIVKKMKIEEQRFFSTLENGLTFFNKVIEENEKKKEKLLDGKDIFKLYDTFGFPSDLSEIMAEEKGFEIDWDSYNKALKDQQERSRKSAKFYDKDSDDDAIVEEFYKKIYNDISETRFLGYDDVSAETSVKTIYSIESRQETKKISVKEKGVIVLDETPFYGEAGGQVGDTGLITSKSGARFKVTDTKKINKIIFHVGEVTEGKLSSGDSVTAEVDAVNRNLIKANHTVTHLLHASLRKVLGDHIKQSGSFVGPERFRFDFSHYEAMTGDEIEKVETLVNQKIWEDIQVGTVVMDYDKAVNDGSIALFDEKYEDQVRVVAVDDFSKELCGGTHVDSTGKIGLFKILKEQSPGAGIRRIEGVTLRGILEKYNAHNEIIARLSEMFNTAEEGITSKVENVVENLNALEKQVKKFKKDDLASNIDAIIETAVVKDDLKIITHLFEDVEVDELRELSDRIKNKEKNSVVCFGSNNGGKPLLIFSATKSAVEKGVDCNDLVKKCAKIVGGGGGGRKDMAQAGGKNADKLDEALKEALKLLS